MNHPYFSGVDWENITQSTAPYIPEVSSPTDTSNFDVDDNDIRVSDAQPPSHNSAFSGLHLPFVGFTFTQGSNLSDLGHLKAGQETTGVPASSSIQNIGSVDNVDGLARAAYERRIDRLEQENKELARKLVDKSKTLQDMVHGPGLVSNGENMNIKVPGSSEESAKLKEEVASLTQKNAELEGMVQTLETNSQELFNRSAELERTETEKSRVLRDAEKQLGSSRTEKEDLSRDLCEAQEKLKLQSRELKDALAQRKLAMSEYTEVTDKLSELRQQKQKMSRQVRDKEEELENSMTKIDSLRTDIRKAEKLRREIELRAEEATTEAGKERKLREKADLQIKSLEKDMASIKSGSLSASGNDVGDLVRAKAEVERLEVSTQETLLAQQAKHNLEVSSLKEQLEDSELRLRSSDLDMASLREKLDQARMDSLQESEETMAELKNVYEREKLMLMEENKKLQFEYERTVEINNRLQLERRQFEEDYHDLRNKKEAVAQWEAQISEIINWVSDEKDARGYLQALASKMTG